MTQQIDRRQFFAASAATAAAVTVASAAQGATGTPTLKGPYIDLTTGKGTVNLMARINGNMDETKVKYGSASGIVSGVRPKERIQDLFGFEVVAAAQNETQPDGSVKCYHVETILYTDLATGEVLKEYKNPYTNELVKVVDVVNDPWNMHFEEFARPAPAYGGLNQAEADSKRKENVLPWTVLPNGLITAMRNINLYYKNALQPDKWPRESSGPMNQVSECYTYVVNLAEAQNPNLTSLQTTGTWSRTTPWLPWMLMGEAPGHTLYQSTVMNFDDINFFKKPVREHMEKYHPHMLKPPSKDSWSKPNLSSLEVYAKTQKPAPAKAGS
jgi:hypothetical protein